MNLPAGLLSTGRAQALLIGCGRFDSPGWPPIRSAARTLEGLASVLQKRCGINPDAVTVLLDPSDPVTVLEAAAVASERAKDDVLLLYLLSHASTSLDGRLRLMMSGSHGPDAPGIESAYTQLAYQDVLRVVIRADRPRVVVPIVDCCGAGRAIGETFGPITHYYVFTAAARDTAALAPPGEEFTTFGGQIIRLLEHGAPEFGPTIRLYDFGKALSNGIPPAVCSGTTSAGALTLATNPHPLALQKTERKPGGIALPATGKCPYPGLAGFQKTERQWFRGREQAITEVIADLTSIRAPSLPLILCGPSGSGKSSFLRAGVLPALDQPTGRAPMYQGILVEPEGPQPLRELLRHLAGLPEPAAPDLLIAIDQFEKVFAPEVDASERERFIAALCELGRGGTPSGFTSLEGTRVQVLLSVRSEYFALLAASHDTLREALTHRQYILAPLTQDELRRAIIEPAEMEGITPELELVAQLCADVAAASQPTHATDTQPPMLLPHLAQVLQTLWWIRTDDRLTLAAYQTIGGLTKAIARSAEETIARLDEGAQQIARALLLSLVRYDGNQPYDLKTVPREVLLDGLSEDRELAERTLAAFLDSRLVVEGSAGLTIVHASLLDAWPRMRRWLDADREWLVIREHIHQAAREWEATGRIRQNTMADDVIADYFTAATERGESGGLTDQAWAFLTTGMQARHRLARRRQRSRRMFWLNVGSTIVALALLGAAISYGLHEHGAAGDAQAADLAARLDAEAETVRFTDPDLAARLAATAYRRSAGPRTWGVLVDTAVQAHPTALSAAGSSRLSGTFAAISDTLAASASPGNPISVIRVSDGRPFVVLGDSQGFDAGMAFDHGGRILAGGDHSGAVRLWEVQAPRSPPRSVRPTTFQTFDESAKLSVTFSADDSLLAIAQSQAGADGKVSSDGEVWRVASGSVPGLVVALPGSFVRFTGAGSSLAVEDSEENWRLESGDLTHPTVQALPPLRHTAPYDVCFSPRGDLYARVSATTTLWTANAGSGAEPVADLGNSTGSACEFSPDGSLVTFSGTPREVWSVASSRHPLLLSVIETPARPQYNGSPDVTHETARFSPDGRLLTIAGDPPHVWDISALRQPGFETELPSGDAPQAAAAQDPVSAVDPRGHRTATLSDSSVVISSDASGSKRTAAVINQPGATVTALAFNQAGTILAVGTDQGTVVLLMLDAHASPVSRSGLPPRASAITRIGFGANDQVMITASDHRTLTSTLNPAALIKQTCATAATPQLSSQWASYAPGSPDDVCEDDR